MLGLGVPATSSLTPMAIAHGASDPFLVALNEEAVSYDMPLYVRPMAEMNGWWNSYCAYNHNGSSKGPRYSTSQFRKAFRRIYLIVHGAPNADARLKRMGLPPVHGSLMPAPMVRVVWNPQGFGSPDLPGNSAQAYYPGNGYVDVVGDDLYDQHFKAEWPAADALYRAHPHKPFAFPEWGLWGIDDPSFIRTMAGFVHTHRRTILISYFSGKPHSTWDLSTKPRSRALYRQLIAPLGR
jgi:beta-mannanase